MYIEKNVYSAVITWSFLEISINSRSSAISSSISLMVFVYSSSIIHYGDMNVSNCYC